MKKLLNTIYVTTEGAALRKREERLHPFLGEKAPLGLVAFLQAQMLARHLRGDLDAYPPWFWK